MEARNGAPMNEKTIRCKQCGAVITNRDVFCSDECVELYDGIVEALGEGKRYWIEVEVIRPTLEGDELHARTVIGGKNIYPRRVDLRTTGDREGLAPASGDRAMAEARLAELDEINKRINDYGFAYFGEWMRDRRAALAREPK